MNKLLGLMAVCCGTILASPLVANAGGACCAPACAPACPEDQKMDACWCMYVHYEPCYYQEPRCVTEEIPCTKTCARYVDKCYEVQRCRYVPEYFTETVPYQEIEYYEMPDCKICQKTVYDTKCEYRPTYYWKDNCGNVVPCSR